MPRTYQEILFIVIELVAFIGNPNEFVNGASVQMHYQSTQNDYFANDLPHERADQMKIPKGQTLIVRLPSNTLLKYTAYKDISILHFRIPPDTRTAFFTFKAVEESKSAFQRKCKPRYVTLHLKASSYPVISPENITFPKSFLSADQRFKIYDLQFKSDEVQKRITINGPQMGNWFAVAFLSWTDPNNDRIEQQGLAASCDTLLLAELSVTRFHPIIVNNGQIHNSNLTSNYSIAHYAVGNAETKNSSHSTTIYASMAKPAFQTQLSSKTETSNGKIKNNSNPLTNEENIYKFYVPENIGSATALITIAQVCLQCPDVDFRIQANAFPYNTETDRTDEDSYIHTTIINSKQKGETLIKFHVQPNSWHYALLKFATVGSKTQTPDLRTISEIKLPDKPLLRRQSIFGPEAFLQVENDQLEGKNKKEPSFVRGQHITDGGSQSSITVKQTLRYSIQIDLIEPVNNVPKKAADHEYNTAGVETKTTSILNITSKTFNSSDVRSEAPNSWRPLRFRDMEFYPLLRQTYREFFMFDYDLVPDINGTVPTILNLTAGTPAGFSFEVGEVYDIGGTLSFAVSMKHSLKNANDLKSTTAFTSAAERNGILAEKLISHSPGSNPDSVDSVDDDNKILPRSNQTIIVCMHLGEPGEPTWPDKCRYGRKVLPASSIVNNTDSNTSTGIIHVPFPESGQWYVTMGLYCHGAETAARITVIDSVKEFVKKYASMLDIMTVPCACARSADLYQACVNDSKCLIAMNETEILKIKECLMDSKCSHNYIEMTQRFETHHKSATEQHFAVDNCNTSVVFAISSSPCVAGRCGRFGRCYHYMSGGFVFSTCVCMKGYRGWDCSEDTQVPSNMSILLASLLLTFSNLLFFPSIYMALRRKYYTEAAIYFFAMFFSIFYHACDSGEDEYSFCLVKIGVLQFCDFYCGLLAIWVTLVAMSHIRPQFASLLHMFGAILLAFGTELNKQSLWVFLAPALTGICIISASWGLRCYSSGKLFPAQKYLTVYMPLGMVLVMAGLVCYAFLQTKQNYHIVHSIWHMVMALSILCLLPSRKTFIPKC